MLASPIVHLPFFSLVLSVMISSSSLPLSLCIYASCCFPLLPSISPLVTWATLAVEIKVIKDLPWPPPVGQLNASSPVVEELESPSQTAQPPPGQTSCDQHHHGGCWCSPLPASLPPPSQSSIVHQFIIPFIHLSICWMVWVLKCVSMWSLNLPVFVQVPTYITGHMIP